MENILSAVGIALTAAIFAVLLKKDAPSMALILTLAATLYIFYIAIESMGQITTSLKRVMEIAGIDNALYLPVLKAVAIAALVRITASFCRDAGQSSLAAKLELAGATAAITVTLPLFTKVLSLVTTMIT